MRGENHPALEGGEKRGVHPDVGRFGSGFWGFGFRVSGFVFHVSCFDVRGLCCVYRVSCFEIRDLCVVSRAQVCVLRVQDFVASSMVSGLA